jgi:DNA-binding transcriptional regulator YdaS (Cro superfamily)
MNKTKAIEKAGGLRALARLLDITPSAISQWGDALPQARLWQLKVIQPTWFKNEVLARQQDRKKSKQRL